MIERYSPEGHHEGRLQLARSRIPEAFRVLESLSRTTHGKVVEGRPCWPIGDAELVEHPGSGHALVAEDPEWLARQ